MREIDANLHRLRFLHNAANLTLAIAPSLSRHYNSTLLHLVTESSISSIASAPSSSGLRLSDGIAKKLCRACGSVFVPGLNCAVRIVPTGLSGGKVIKMKRKRARRKQVNKTGDLDSVNEDGKGDRVQRVITHSKPISLATKRFLSEDPVPAIKRRRMINLNLKSHQPPPNTTTATTSSLPLTSDIQQQQDQQSMAKEPNPYDVMNLVVYVCNICGSETRMPGSLRQLLPHSSTPSVTTARPKKLKQDAPVSIPSSSTSTSRQSSPLPPSLPTPTTNTRQPIPLPAKPTAVNPPLGKKGKQGQGQNQQAGKKKNDLMKSLLASRAKKGGLGGGGLSMDDISQ
ncbi:hypothetical protein HDU76_012679 [Blyttiomyces sp. JEL0837]|nr:hypothetical protein HDU76_012679 [Blyttiomyces sp. JEL0837]